MKIKIKIFDEKVGYSIDVSTWRGRLLKQKLCRSLMEASDFLTDIFNLDDDLDGIVGWFIEDRLKIDQNAEISAWPLYEEFRDWYRKKVGGRVISVTAFGRIMGRRFVKMKKEGRIVYVGLTHREDRV